MASSRDALRVLLSSPPADVPAIVTRLAQLGAERGVPVVVGDGTRQQLSRALDGPARMWRWLAELATTTNHPIVVHLAGGQEGHTVLLPPAGWTEERSAGYFAGLADELVAQYGPLAGRPVRASDGLPVLSARKGAA